MNSITKLVRLNRLAMNRATIKSSARLASSVTNQSMTAATNKVPDDFDPNNYSIPLRPATMNDGMEPYGPWKLAYAAEKKRGNRALLLGVLSLAVSLTVLINSGEIDGLYMPNLDNIMEETESFSYDTEGRVSV